MSSIKKSKGLKKVKCQLKTTDENSSLGGLNEACSPALLNELVLDCIFGSLSLQDLKECRLVCTHWNLIAEPMVRKLSRISLSPLEKSLSEYNSVFDQSSSTVPFDALTITSFNATPWNISELNSILAQWKSKLKSLNLLSVSAFEKLNNKRRTSLKSFSLYPEVLSKLNKLEINCWGTMTGTSVSVRDLTSIKFIAISFDAVLDISNIETKLIPKEIHLDCVKYQKDGEIIDSVILNDFIDFSQATTIYLSTDDNKTEVSVNMGGDAFLDYLTLKNIEILDEKDSKWSVKKFVYFDGVSFTEENLMSYTNMDFKNGLIDVCALPQSIECLRLSFNEDKLVHSVSDIPLVFENLKYLSIKADMGDETLLPLFRECPNVTDIFNHNFSRTVNTNNDFEIEWLPRSVRRLEICEISISPDSELGDDFIALDTLILSNWKAKSCQYIFNPFEFSNLVICTRNCGGYTSEPAKQYYLKNLRKVIKFVHANKVDVVVYLGPLTLSKDNRFLQYIDPSTIDMDALSVAPQTFWFRFKENIGVTIEESEFNQLRILPKSQLFPVE